MTEPLVQRWRLAAARLTLLPLAVLALLLVGCGDGIVATPDKDAGVDSGPVSPFLTADATGGGGESAGPADKDADDTGGGDEDGATGGGDPDTTGNGGGGVPDVDEPKPGEVLHSCDKNEDCFSLFCVDSPAGEVCTSLCEGDSSCPDGWSCTAVGFGEPQFICIPNDTFLCRPCQSDDQCNTPGYPKTGVCMQAGALGSFCSRLCDSSTTCPHPFTCGETQPYGEDGPTLELCLADDPDACNCTPKFVAENAKTTCYIENEFGRCYGETICLTEGPLPGCSAPDPIEETCNGLDDDCDGETDEDAIDCEVMFLDSDGDGFGQGIGDCLCEKPSDKWISDGGDCNELVTNINPGAPESCNGLDDDCDGETDEQDAQGCADQYEDVDADLYGKTDVTACFCAGTDGWAPDPGDCNDLDPNVSPADEETCDGIDNDCDDAIDEVGALGCNPFFLDQDGDGYGLTDKVKCLCGPTGVYIGSQPNDCDDLETSINPSVPELCNGVDDNCNGDTDEGESSAMCPQVANGTASCVDGTCSLTDCEDDWSDADGDPLNGCECPQGNLEVPGGAGENCQEPQTLGNASDGGAELVVTDNIAPASDVDWYRFTAIDGADPDSCDTFDVQVSFVHNPQEQFAFDVFAGGCAASQELCKLVTNFSSTTHLNTQIAGEPIGECPCTVEDPPPEGFQLCKDQTESYWVKVYRKPDHEPSCAAYTLRITNGM